MELAGRIAVVTGGSRGIGAAICRRFAAEGARVVVNGRDAKAVERVVAEIGGSARGFVADNTDAAALARLAEFAGPADILVANAGGAGEPVPTVELTEERWRGVVEGNLTATFLAVRAFLPGMIARRRGAIVTMASSAGRMPSLANAAYAAAKAGVIMLTRHLALEVAPHGVRLNCVAPSAIRTERLARLPADQLAQIGAHFPLRRIGEPDEVARAALYLASDAAGWVTGVTLDVASGKVI